MSKNTNKDIAGDEAEVKNETIKDCNVEKKDENIEQTNEKLLAEEKDKYLRLFAEFENYKKRSTKERMDFFKYANQEMLIVLLPIIDDFDRCVKELERENSEAIEGIKLIQNKFNTTLKEKGLEKIEVAIGDIFDVEKHEAITQMPTPNEELKDKIVDIIEEGYQLKEKVIRFAKVIVGK